MKYQYILNDTLLFESNDASAFIEYLITNKDAVQAKLSILYNLLERSNGYICNMSSASKQ